jgi:hypothetical protein
MASKVGQGNRVCSSRHLLQRLQAKADCERGAKPARSRPGFNGDPFHTRNCLDSCIRQKVINDTNLIGEDLPLIRTLAAKGFGCSLLS